MNDDIVDILHRQNRQVQSFPGVVDGFARENIIPGYAASAEK